MTISSAPFPKYPGCWDNPDIHHSLLFYLICNPIPVSHVRTQIHRKQLPSDVIGAFWLPAPYFLIADRPCLTPCRTAKMGYRSLFLCMPVHNVVTAGERNPSLAAQSSTRGLSRERQSQRNPASLFPAESQKPHSLTPTTSTPTQPAQRIGAETRTLEGAGQSSVRTCGMGGYHCGICNLQNLLPHSFLNSASTLADASPHHTS